MGNDPADDDDELYNNKYFRRGRVGAWNANYLRKFTSLLQANTVLLQTMQKYPKNDPIHELRARAMEHMREELGMTDIEQVKQKMITFKKFAANKLKQCAEKCGPLARPETILKAAPAWLRAVEPHMSLWSQIHKAKALPEKAPPEPEPASDWLDGECRGTRLALALVQNARELRSLDADVVCKQDCVPAEKIEELKYVWWRMLHVVTQKLNFQRDGSEAIPAARLSPVEALLADLLLLLDPTIATLPESSDYDSLKHLVTLFHLAQLHRLERVGPGLIQRWQRAHSAYKTVTPQISGVCCSIVIMQRRWHELKTSARRAVVQYSRQQAPPSPLYAAIVKRFPHVVTEPLPTWQELVESGRVIEDEQQAIPSSSSEAEGEELEMELEGVSLLSPEDLQILKPYQRSAKEEEDDLVLIEKEIETIDLINVADDKDNELEQRTAQKNSAAAALASELDRQLKDIQKHAGVSETELLSEPYGEPTLIYDSDSDVECTEDRNKNIEMIAKQILSDGASSVVKKEPDSEQHSVEGDACINDDDDCIAIDEKLLMETRVTLLRVDSTPEWKLAAKRPRIDLTLLNLKRFAAKKPRLDTPILSGENEAILEKPYLDLNVQVKVEKIEEESVANVQPKGERQVKSMAKRLISEMMREETEEQASDKSKVTKKVQLPNIEEVRKNNLSILTAQVAPLASGEGALPPSGGALLERKLSTDSDGELQIDETFTEPTAGDVTLSQRELRSVLEKLAVERESAVATRAQGVNSHAAYCCTARRQRALNAARRRLAARSGKMAPPYLDIHSTSACAEKKCKCCCKHLLIQDERGARLVKEALEVEVALRRLLGEDPSEKGTLNPARKNTHKRKKKNQYEEEEKLETDLDLNQYQNDPLKEWIRQKSLNKKYFNLNLNRPEKPKSQNKEIETAPKPNTLSQSENVQVFANVVKKTVYRSNPHALPSEKGAKSLYTIIQSPIANLTPSTSQSTTNHNSFTTKLLEGNNRPLPSKLINMSLPASNSGKFINFKVTDDKGKADLNKKLQIAPGKSGVQTSFGTIVTTANQKKMLVLSPSEKSKLTLATASFKNIQGKIVASTSKDTPQISTVNGTIIIDSTYGKIIPITPGEKNLESMQGKLVANTLGLKAGIPVTSGNAFTTIPKIVSVTSLRMNEEAAVTPVDLPTNNHLQGKVAPVKLPTSSFQLQRKVASTLPRMATITSLSGTVAPTLPGIGTITSLPGNVTTSQVIINQKNIVTASQGKLLKNLLEKKSLPITRIVRKSTNNFNFATIKSPVKIAPKPEKTEHSGQKQDVDVQSQETNGQSGQLRGTGMKISKISSSSGQPAERSIRTEDKPGPSGVSPSVVPRVSPPKNHRLLIMDTDGSMRELQVELDNGNTTMKEMTHPLFKLETHFKRKDYTLPIDKYLQNKDPTNLTVLVVDDSSNYLTVRSAEDHYLVLTESDLAFSLPSYWSMVYTKFSARISFERKISVKSVAALNSSNVVMAAPEKIYLDGHVYVKLKVDPLIYAKALFVIRTPTECNSELLRSSKLYMLNTKGTMTSVERSFELGEDKFALTSPNVTAAKALAEVLNDLPSIVPPPTGSDPPVKSDVNARADVVMMMNNVNRKPIEMVYVDSDDEEEKVVKKEFDFKGLEKFEELDEFDL